MDIVFKELAIYFDVILCTSRLEFRNYGKQNIGDVRIIVIKSFNDFPSDKWDRFKNAVEIELFR